MTTDFEKLDIKKISYDEEFKISRPFADESLLQSIKRSGVKEPLLLFKNDEKYRILSGHNRYKAALVLNFPDVPSIIVPSIVIEDLLRVITLKNFYSRLGPFGRIKSYLILKKINLDNSFSIPFARDELRIPEEFISDDNLSRLMNLPELIIQYADMKDISFKIIKKLLFLRPQSLFLICKWLESAKFKVNIFNKVIEMLFEIEKKENGTERLRNIENVEGVDFDKLVYDKVYSERYPEYSVYKKKSDDIRKKFLDKGIDIIFPDYFEGDKVEIKLQLSKMDGGNRFLKAVDNISDIDIKELLFFI